MALPRKPPSSLSFRPMSTSRMSSSPSLIPGGLKLVLLFLIVACYIDSVSCFIEGLYCGRESCYDVLGVTRESPRDEIAKAYRKLARKWHPDMHRGAEAKKEATINFQRIATAYEVLKDDDSRKDYDYMLDNPDEFYHHYYRYYRRMYAPKVDVRIVLIVTITVISGVQYWAGQSRYREAIDYFLTVPKYRLRAQEIAKQEGLLPDANDSKATQAYKKKNRYKSKDDIRAQEESILREIIEDQMDIKGAYAKPKYTDILWVQLIMLPYTIYKWIFWYIRWFYKFDWKKEPYGDEEKEYLIRRNMKMSQAQWEALEDHERESYMDDELWIKKKFDVWKAEKDAELKAQLAEKGSYKRYRRYMKKGGPGQITFLDD